ncbi:helix-turn-helix domain-containing protein, partial [Acidithiobacillus ferrooxidans]|nr:helix-turn-helix domain-containing protein [Acidithiobacillus ferrooxidans]
MDMTTENEISQDLRAAREAHGWSLRQVAERLHITEAQVKGLEDGDYTALPGAAFARGFLKNYARLLGLDPEPLLKTYDASNEGSGLHPSETVLPASEGPLLDYSRRVLIFSVLIVISVIAVAWWVWSHQQLQGLPVTAVSPMVAKHPAASAKVVTIAPSVSAAASVPAIGNPPAAPGLPVAPVPATRSAAVATGPGLTFQFSADCWVQVKDSTGKTLLAVLGHRGDVLRVDSGTPPYNVLVGKASAITISYDDKSVPLPANALGVARLQIGATPIVAGVPPHSVTHVVTAAHGQVPP